MKYTAPIRRIDTAKGHHYIDGNRTRVTGVTAILDAGLPKKALINWAGTATAEAAVNRWDELSELAPATRLKELQNARYAEKDKAARRGTEVHRHAEALIGGDTIDVPAELHGYVESYARLLDAYRVEPVEVEFGVGHYTYGYAGTVDLAGYFTHKKWGRRLLLVDLKTSRSGIFGEVALQLAAYRYAEVILGDDTRDEQPMIEVDGCAGIHVRADGADLIPITAEKAEFNAFRAVRMVAEFGKNSRDLIGAPVAVDADSPMRLVRVDE